MMVVGEELTGSTRCVVNSWDSGQQSLIPASATVCWITLGNSLACASISPITGLLLILEAEGTRRWPGITLLAESLQLNQSLYMQLLRLRQKK